VPNRNGHILPYPEPAAAADVAEAFLGKLADAVEVGNGPPNCAAAAAAATKSQADSHRHGGSSRRPSDAIM